MTTRPYVDRSLHQSSESQAQPSPDNVCRELGEVLSDKMEDIYGAHEAWGTGERHVKHLRSRPTYRVRAGTRRALGLSDRLKCTRSFLAPGQGSACSCSGPFWDTQRSVYPLTYEAPG